MTIQGAGWAVLFAGLNALAAHAVAAPASATPGSCAAPAYRQFDFWIGDWDVYDVSDPTKTVARVRVDLILDGCVLREDYEGANGAKGHSLTMYDASRKLWRQSWVTNRGQWLQLGGGLQNGEMVLSGVDRTADGKERQVRGVWKPDRGRVREKAVTSLDGGKTWIPWFDLWFRPSKP